MLITLESDDVPYLFHRSPDHVLAISGLKIHFLRSKAKPKSSKVKVIPLMLVHGWPGSFVEFLDIIPLLNEGRDDIGFDVVVPSIPGYGFSDAASRHGTEQFILRRIMTKANLPFFSSFTVNDLYHSFCYSSRR